MGTISNRFYVTALEDGTTLHGNLSSDRTLTQGWTGSSCLPNWEMEFEQPTIYLTLLSGSTPVAPESDFKWYYNACGSPTVNGQTVNEEIQFDNTTGKSTLPAIIANKFQKVTYSYRLPGSSESVNMPGLKIIGNLASDSNKDLDIITFKGSYATGGSSIDFSADIQIRMTTVNQGGSLGIISFVNGTSNITRPRQVLYAYGELFTSTAYDTGQWTTAWYINGDPAGVQESTYTLDGKTYNHCIPIREGDITDHATITCVFTKNSTTVATAYAFVDDMQDPEFMYIQYNGNNGNSASLRSNDIAKFDIWVGTRDSAAVLTDAGENPVYNVIKVQLLDGEAKVIDNSGIVSGDPTYTTPDPDTGDAQFWRTLTMGTGMNAGKAKLGISYATASTLGKKNLTGIVKAMSVENV